jgi:hypothetical protein
MQIKRKLLNFTLQIISYGVVLVEPPELIDIAPESGNELIWYLCLCMNSFHFAFMLFQTLCDLELWNETWAAARQPHAGVVLQRSGCELCGRLDQRAVVGIHVRHGCRLQLRELGLQRQGARGPRGCLVHRHDGRDGVRGVEVDIIVFFVVQKIRFKFLFEFFLWLFF